FWLDDYALYMALKNENGGKEWLLWDKELRFRKKDAIKAAKKRLKKEIDFWKYLQYEFQLQYEELLKYAHSKKIYIIGDIPLYVALDSSDVWTNPELFDLDSERRPRHVAGVPPDIFSADGQRWGNPIYNWDKMEEDNFKWWRRRMKKCADLYDVIRIDHFIGIVNYWSVPAEEETAINGEWIKGPGKKLTDVIKSAVGDSKVIAEDLGVITKPVQKLIDKCKWPGMKILQFAFDGGCESTYLPQNYKNCNYIVYGGTHDNDTAIGYLESIPEKQLLYIKEFLGLSPKASMDEVNDAIIRLGFMSTAHTVIFQVQDLLGLDTSARMNMPSTIGTNWQFRMAKKKLPANVVKKLKKYTKLYNRKA
ncbi:MAG: 4-alpha-glucanotransferase, partial [Lachnospiraceae bacterium]|nr:4-alpha-glucanotransferase [Lachnospiraceae bacterium]